MGSVKQSDQEEISLTVALKWRDDVVIATDSTLGHARRHIQIYSYDLEPEILDRQAVLDQLLQFCRLSRDNLVQILVRDGKKAAQSGNRIIELGRRLSPQIQFRKPSPHKKQIDGSFVLADDEAYLARPRRDRYFGTADLNAPAKVAELRSYFEDHWQFAEEELEMRQLHI
ncbi:MAG: hypothetical protein AAF402_15695 [Pseudomonadota bacterium]